ncbi:nucleotide disphospho-sugar-binding domain-containing protein [Streptomyces sp. NPDC051561]|uniref:nucleotide disphospho-sugar-binding domain-containing protein n=1 Tax=Streptomyces sp. NPDC051561 TaxID=3365658 RepID=UPI0037B3A837
MRTLFITGGGSGPACAIAPLASATRTEGHDILVAAPRENVQELTERGLPTVEVTELGVFQAMFTDRDGNKNPPPRNPADALAFASRGFGHLTASSLHALRELVRTWRPDILVGGTRNYAAALLAHEFGLPYVCQAWDQLERVPEDLVHAAGVLRPELDALGLDGLPAEDLYIHQTPPSVRPPDAEPARHMRWVPGNSQVPLEPWMYTRPSGRRRVCITSGSRSTMVPGLGIAFFRPLLANPVFDDVEVVVATKEEVAVELKREHPALRAGFVPLDVVAPTCDLLVHHGGGVTAMAAVNAGIPQLVLVDMPASAIPMGRIQEYGAGISLPADATADDVAASCDKILSDASFAARARDLAAENAAQPPASAAVRWLEELVDARR